MATGDSYKTIGFSFRVGTSTVVSVVRETCAALWSVLQPLVLPEPDEAYWRRSAEEFGQKWNFPNCSGAIDGKHCTIRAPPASGSLYYNYKGTYSIVLLAVVDANYCFSVVDIGSYGRNSDGGRLARSGFGRALENGSMSLPPDEDIPGIGKMPYVIVGDEAFPLKRS